VSSQRITRDEVWRIAANIVKLPELLSASHANSAYWQL
jgi:hypothetical protein